MQQLFHIQAMFLNIIYNHMPMAFTSLSLIVFSFMLLTVIASAGDYSTETQLVYKPNLDLKEKPLPIAIQGIILCKSGSKTIPIKGAVARITCVAVDDHGYEAAPFSILTKPTDSKGYYFATLFPQQLINTKLKLNECKAFLQKSPLETCKEATDVNKGRSGAPISYGRLLTDKKMNLYSVPPFIYTSSSQTKPISDGY